MDWNDKRLRFYIEAGLAVLLVLTLALAGASGRLSASADDSGSVAEAVSGQENSAQAEQGSSQAEAEGNAGTAEETIAEGQYPIMGESPVTVREMVDYFNSSGKEYPSDQLSKGGADSIETFCQMYYEEASAEGVRPEVAFAQTMKETGFLQYGGDASIELISGRTDRDTRPDPAPEGIRYI